MSNIEDLKKEELINLQAEEVPLEDLIVMGADKKIPIHIEYPQGDNIIRTKCLVKQLTIKQLKNINITPNSDVTEVLPILAKSMCKQNGENFTTDELSLLPIGVLKAILTKIFELSGIDEKEVNLKDF